MFVSIKANVNSAQSSSQTRSLTQISRDIPPNGNSLCQHAKFISISGNSLAVQWLGLHAFTAECPDSIPGQGTKIPPAVWHGQKMKFLNKFFPIEKVLFSIGTIRFIYHIQCKRVFLLFEALKKIHQYNSFQKAKTKFIKSASLEVL